MNREIIDINDYTILLEEASTDKSIVDSCFFDEPVIAIAFYGAGDVGLKVKFPLQIKEFRILGLSINDSLYGSVFFFLTGLHFFHLIIGLLLLSLLFWSCNYLSRVLFVSAPK